MSARVRFAPAVLQALKTRHAIKALALGATCFEPEIETSEHFPLCSAMCIASDVVRARLERHFNHARSVLAFRFILLAPITPPRVSFPKCVDEKALVKEALLKPLVARFDDNSLSNCSNIKGLPRLVNLVSDGAKCPCYNCTYSARVEDGRESTHTLIVVRTNLLDKGKAQKLRDQ